MSRQPTMDQLTPCRVGILNTAILTARDWMSRVVPIVNSLPAAATPSRQQAIAIQELRRLFGINVDDPLHRAHLRTVQNRLTQMQTRLGTLTAGDFRCVTQRYPVCGPLQQAEAFVTGNTPIYLCATAFEHEEPPFRSFTVIHEVAHLCGAMGLPERYSPTCSPYAMQMDILAAVNHAEHYACLVKLIHQGIQAIHAEEETRRIMEALTHP